MFMCLCGRVAGAVGGLIAKMIDRYIFVKGSTGADLFFHFLSPVDGN